MDNEFDDDFPDLDDIGKKSTTKPAEVKKSPTKPKLDDFGEFDDFNIDGRRE